MLWEFATSARIVFGAGSIAQLGPIASALGRRALVVTGSDPNRVPALYEQLKAAGVDHHGVQIVAEPTTHDAERAVAEAREAGCEFVIGLGGGSAVDAGKAIAALLTNRGGPLDYLEVIGLGKALEHAPAPFIAIPTTAGTGSEVTRNAVLKSPEHAVKVSLRSARMLPTVTLIDPALGMSAPPEVTADCGLDALTQLVEPYVSNKANPLTDALCREGMTRAARALRRAYRDGNDLDARSDMALAALFGGLALANAKLGAVHGFAGPLGGMYPAPHGALCGRLLPFVTETNVRALGARAPGSPALARYDEVARLLTGNPQAHVQDVVQWLHELCADLRVRGLARYGVAPEAFGEIVAKASRSSSMKGNPLALSNGELTEILRRAL